MEVRVTDHGLQLSVDGRGAMLLLSDDRRTVVVRTSPNWRLSTNRYCYSFKAGCGSTKAWRGATVTTYGLGHSVHNIHNQLSHHEASSEWQMSYDSNSLKVHSTNPLSEDHILDIWNIVTGELQRKLEQAA